LHEISEEKVTNMMKLEALIHETLEEFYRQRIKKLAKVKLRDVLGYKNLYLLCADGGQSGGVIVEEMLRAYMSLSDESIFGDAFIESLARIGSEEVNGSTELDSAYKAIALIDLMRNDPTLSRIEFDDEWSKAVNRLSYDFLNNFGNPDGSIDWEKMLRYNSGKDNVPWVSKVIPVTSVEDQEDESNDDDASDGDDGNEDQV
jgi:type II restriction endonuclease EcoO109I-like protein